MLACATVVLLLVGTGAFYYLRYAGQFEGTDDAYLDGNLHPVSARVNGTVTEVLTDDNRPARLGEPLLRLDPRDFEVALDEARSNGLSAEAAVPQAEAQIDQARAQLDQADAGIAQAKAQLDKAVLDLKRADELMRKNVSTQSENDTARANHEVAAANAASARATREAAAAMLRAAEANLQVAVARRGTAQASVRDAELQLSYATIPAPADGHIGKKSVEVGQRVGPGQPLLALVGADNWIVANFKEHQLAHMQPGQAVEITRGCRGRPPLRRYGGEFLTRHGSQVLSAAARQRHGQFHQDRPARAGQDPLHARELCAATRTAFLPVCPPWSRCASNAEARAGLTSLFHVWQS